MAQAPDNLAVQLEASSQRRVCRHLQRQRRPLGRSGPVQVEWLGQTLINFSSNDYLGLAADEALISAVRAAALSHGVGSGASALITGYSPAHDALERELAEFLQVDRVLLCVSGYHANLAVLTSLAGRDDVIVQDRLCHASLIDGARLSGAELRRYAHADPQSLARQLDRGSKRHSLVVTDGVFSMDGDVAPLSVLAGLCKARGAWLVVDDAHGIGVLGPRGRGSVAESGLSQNDVPVLVGTLGKAFGGAGAFIAGSTELVDHVMNEGRAYLFTTALSPVMAEAGRAALGCVQRDEWRRTVLADRIAQFREKAVAAGLTLADSNTPIQPLVIGDSGQAVRLSEQLLERGFLVQAIRPPTVAPGSERLRITLSCVHEAQHVDDLVTALRECLHP